MEPRNKKLIRLVHFAPAIVAAATIWAAAKPSPDPIISYSHESPAGIYMSAPVSKRDAEKLLERKQAAGAYHLRVCDAPSTFIEKLTGATDSIPCAPVNCIRVSSIEQLDKSVADKQNKQKSAIKLAAALLLSAALFFSGLIEGFIRIDSSNRAADW